MGICGWLETKDNSSLLSDRRRVCIALGGIGGSDAWRLQLRTDGWLAIDVDAISINVVAMKPYQMLFLNGNCRRYFISQ